MELTDSQRSLSTRLASVALIFWMFNISQAQTILSVADVTEESLRAAIEDVRALRQKGDSQPVVIELPSGTFYLSHTIKIDSKLAGDGLRFRATKNGDTIFSGAEVLLPEGCEAKSPHILWRYCVPEDFVDKFSKSSVPRVLTVDGELKTAARSAALYHRIDKALPDRRSGFFVSEGDLPADFELGSGPCDMVLLHDWSSTRMPVRSYDRATRELRSWGPIGCSAPHYAIDHFEKRPRYWLEGHPSFLDQYGEWYYDAESHSVVVLHDYRRSTDREVLWPQLETIVEVRGDDETPVRAVAFQGIRFSGSRFPMPAAGLATGQATTHEVRRNDGSRAGSNREHLSAAVTVANATGVLFQSCEFTQLGNSGLWIGQETRGCRVERCHFDQIGGNAINLGEDSSRQVEGQVWYKSAPEQVPSKNVVRSCQIQNCGQVLPGSVAIWAGLHRELEIADNTIRDCPYSGISLGWIWNTSNSPAGENHIHGNRIDNVMQVLSDGGGIYTLGQQAGTVIEGNVISDIRPNAGRAESNAMFFDQGSQGMTVRDNIIRRIAKSPLRFHQAGPNQLDANRWELKKDVPPVRYNRTPEENISLKDNQTIEPQKSYFTIGNSLTWDTVPSRLDGNVHWHVDCGKSLPFIENNPTKPCVSSSRHWPKALSTTQYDYVSCQPHYGSTLDADVATIDRWMQMQPGAVFVIHTGWARSATRADEFASNDIDDLMTHSPAYINALISQLRKRHPDRTIRQTYAQDMLDIVAADIAAGRAPIKNITDLYRDAIHMTIKGGRYLMHNAMRTALEQPRSSKGFESMDDQLRQYLDSVLDRQLQASAGQGD